MPTAAITGLLSPVVTPFKSDPSPDIERLIRHCRWLLSQDCGLAVFGTNSEANSLSVDERIELLFRLLRKRLEVLGHVAHRVPSGFRYRNGVCFSRSPNMS